MTDFDRFASDLKQIRETDTKLWNKIATLPIEKQPKYFALLHKTIVGHQNAMLNVLLDIQNTNYDRMLIYTRATLAHIDKQVSENDRG